jgi:hypothetical protein
VIQSCAKLRVRMASSINCRGIGWSVLVLTTAATAIGCSKNDLGPREEVRLTDGRVIVVERYESFDVARPIGNIGSAFVAEAKIKVVSPADLASLPELVISYRPIVFDYDAAAGTWFAIGLNERACGPEALRAGHMDERGLINVHPNFEYRMLKGSWRATEIGPERAGYPANLLVQRTTIDRFIVLPLSEKARVDSDFGVPSYLRKVEARLGCG